MTVVRGFIEPIVEDAIQKRKEGSVTNEDTLLHHLLEVSQGKAHYQ